MPALAEFGFRCSGDDDQGIRAWQCIIAYRAGEPPETVAQLVLRRGFDQALEGRRRIVFARPGGLAIPGILTVLAPSAAKSRRLISWSRKTSTGFAP